MKIVDCFVFEGTEQCHSINEAYRTFLVSEDGAIFVCGEVADSRVMLILKAGSDGVSFVNHKKKIFLPIKWLKGEYDKSSDDFFETVEQRINIFMDKAK